MWHIIIVFIKNSSTAMILNIIFVSMRKGLILMRSLKAHEKLRELRLLYSMFNEYPFQYSPCEYRQKLNHVHLGVMVFLLCFYVTCILILSCFLVLVGRDKDTVVLS